MLEVLLILPLRESMCKKPKESRPFSLHKTEGEGEPNFISTLCSVDHWCCLTKGAQMVQITPIYGKIVENCENLTHLLNFVITTFQC